MTDHHDDDTDLYGLDTTYGTYDEPMVGPLDAPDKPSGFHPVNIGHLVMGVAFAGMVLVWALVQGDVVETGELRWLMLRLVSLSDSGEPFRTRLPHSVSDDPGRGRLLDLLVRSRLVTVQAGHYEVAHEALVRGWPRLRAWLEEDAAGQRIRRHLAVAAAGRHAAALLA